VFELEETEAASFVDAGNAFNCLNRETALHNIKFVCPKIAQYIDSTYKKAARLILGNGEEILSREGTTLGDHLAMALYALSIKGLIDKLNVVNCLQEWFADDAAGLGRLIQLKAWWDLLQVLGPKYGYFPKASKCWLIVKSPIRLLEAQRMFNGTGVNITAGGRRYLGSVIGSPEYKRQYVTSKVTKWSSQLKDLEKEASNEPHLAYAVFCKVLQCKWNFLLRTVTDVEENFQPLEIAIHSFCETLCGRTLTAGDRSILALPCSPGGLGSSSPVYRSNREYTNSVTLTTCQKEAIVNKEHGAVIENRLAKNEVQRRTRTANKDQYEVVYNGSSDEVKRSLDLLQPKGTSTWLTSMPSTEHGFYLNREEFRDAISLRYNWRLSNMARTCECGAENSLDHAMICKLGGFSIMRHNLVRDLEGELLAGICKDVVIEPPLIALNNDEKLEMRGNIEDGARLDVACRSLWTPMQKSFFDVRITHPNATSNRSKKIEALLKEHEQEKKASYNDRVRQVEHASFTTCFRHQWCDG
jgi:hypothetical protein